MQAFDTQPAKNTPHRDTKLFLGGFVSTALVLVLIWLMGVKFQLGVPTAMSRWVYEDYAHKTQRAASVSGSRVLIVAGSNALFGVDSSKLAQFWGRPSINLAVNAGLGLPYILDHAKRQIRPGDLVLMPLEYALMLDSGKPNAQVIDYVMARDLTHWRSMSRMQQLEFAFYLSPLRWYQGLQQLQAGQDSIDRPITHGTYGAHHLDENGDQTHTEVERRSESDIQAVRKVSQPAAAWHYGARARNERGGWDRLAEFGRWVRAQGACVVMLPTALLYHESYDKDPVEKDFYQSLPRRIEALGIPYVGQPRDFMYGPEHFFDTDHHLIASSRDMHTTALIAGLKSRSDLCQNRALLDRKA